MIILLEVGDWGTITTASADLLTSLILILGAPASLSL